MQNNANFFFENRSEKLNLKRKIKKKFWREIYFLFGENFLA